MYLLVQWLLKICSEKMSILPIERMTVKNTFGQGRFQRFWKRIDMEVPELVNIVTAYCVLNMCKIQKDEVLEEWMNGEVTLLQRDLL